MAAVRPEGSVRERLLAAADELFYAEGVHSVGIDRVLERAGVAKASLYGTFGSKDELVRAYLQERALSVRAKITNRIAPYPNPRDRILGVFDVLAEYAAESSYQGCPFIRACSEDPSGPTPARDVTNDQRKWRRNLFTELAGEHGVADPEGLGQKLSLLYDGALIGAWMDSDPSAPGVARKIAARLLAGEKPPQRKKTAPKRRPKAK